MMVTKHRWLPAREIQRRHASAIHKEWSAQSAQEEPQDPNGEHDDGDDDGGYDDDWDDDVWDDNDWDDNDDDDLDNMVITNVLSGERPGVHQELSGLLPQQPHHRIAW